MKTLRQNLIYNADLAKKAATLHVLTHNTDIKNTENITK